MDEALETEDVSGDQICGKLPPSGLSSASVSAVYHQLVYQLYNCIISRCFSYTAVSSAGVSAVQLYHHVLDIFSLHEIFAVLSLPDGGVLHCFALSSTLLAVKS